MGRNHRGFAEPESLSRCPSELAQQVWQTGPIEEPQQHPGGARLRTSDTAIDPLQCSNPNPSLSHTQQTMCGYTHNAHAEAKQSNYISPAEHLFHLSWTNKWLLCAAVIVHLQHCVPGTGSGRSCSSWYEYWRRKGTAQMQINQFLKIG